MDDNSSIEGGGGGVIEGGDGEGVACFNSKGEEQVVLPEHDWDDGLSWITLN